MNNSGVAAVFSETAARPSTMKNRGFQLVLTTCPDVAAAGRIARALVAERLAACVNILPVAESVYLWKGQVETAAEQLLVIKSEKRVYRAIEKRVLELHPYELPEVIAVPIAGGFAGYLAWLHNPDKA
jgi:periplasmic divalent cation tolerance protein